MTAAPKTLFNDDCPVCSWEIQHYIRYAEKTGLPLEFDDLNSTDLACWGLTEEAARKRMHVYHDGTVHSGIPAFLILWSHMPRYRWVARIVGLPVIRHIATLLYDYVAAPALYAWDQRRRR